MTSEAVTVKGNLASKLRFYSLEPSRLGLGASEAVWRSVWKFLLGKWDVKINIIEGMFIIACLHKKDLLFMN